MTPLPAAAHSAPRGVPLPDRSHRARRAPLDDDPCPAVPTAALDPRRTCARAGPAIPTEPYTAPMLERLGIWLVAIVLAVGGQTPIVWADSTASPHPSCCGSACRCGDSCPCMARRGPVEDGPRLPPIGLERDGVRAVPPRAFALESVGCESCGEPSESVGPRPGDDSPSGRCILLRKHVLRT
jgi:hypothetical protein